MSGENQDNDEQSRRQDCRDERRKLLGKVANHRRQALRDATKMGKVEAERRCYDSGAKTLSGMKAQLGYVVRLS